jgi:uncharacterized membrane protein (UPF0127 family)
MTLVVRNATRDTVVASRAEAARGFGQNLLGLMFRAALPQGGGLILYGTNWIHTFWMRFHLDCVYMDKRLVVVGVARSMPPNRIGAPYWQAHSVIELPDGAIEASSTRVGDHLEIRNQP